MPEVDATSEIDEATGYQGRVRVIEVGQIVGNTCGGGSGGDVSFEYIEGQGAIDYSGARLVVFGAGTSSAISTAWADPYNVPPPNGKQEERPFMVLDRDGNSDPDLLATAYECAAIAPPNPTQSASMGAYSYVYCIDYWAKESSNEWRKLRQDFFYSCQ